MQGTYYMWVKLNVSNFAIISGNYSSTSLSETAYSISLSKNVTLLK